APRRRPRPCRGDRGLAARDLLRARQRRRRPRRVLPRASRGRLRGLDLRRAGPDPARRRADLGVGGGAAAKPRLAAGARGPMSDVLAATLVAPGTLELRSYPYPEQLEPGAVLLQMLASGICGTDKHTFRGETEQYAGTDHARTTPFPIIQGHENVGVVAEVGAGGALAYDGTPLRPGDRVVPAPNRPCGACPSCLRGF